MEEDAIEEDEVDFEENFADVAIKQASFIQILFDSQLMRSHEDDQAKAKIKQDDAERRIKVELEQQKV